MFERKGEIVVDLGNADEDELLMCVLDAGADDMTTDTNDEDEVSASVICSPGSLEEVRSAIIDAGFQVTTAEVIMQPSNTITIDDVETAAKLLKLLDALDDNDDVNNVYSNYEISDEVMAQL